MEKIKVLYGFNAPKFIEGVNDYLLSRGYEVDCIIRMSKSSIRDFLVANPDYDAAVLLEVLGNNEDDSINRYEAEDFALLTDYTDLNVIPVLNSNLKGSSYMQTLYDAGITSAVYQQRASYGITPNAIGKLILKKRTRKEARDYYGIQKRITETKLLESELIHKYVNYISEDDGAYMASRFIEVCRKMSNRQIADFIKRMPEECLRILQRCEEFYIILDIIRKCGYDLKIKRPKSVQIGLATPGSGLALIMNEVSLENMVIEPTKQVEDTFFGNGYEPEKEESEYPDIMDSSNEIIDADADEDWDEDIEEDVDEIEEQPVIQYFDDFFCDDEEDMDSEEFDEDEKAEPVIESGLKEEELEEEDTFYNEELMNKGRKFRKVKKAKDPLDDVYVKNTLGRKKPEIPEEKLEKEADLEGEYLSKLVKIEEERKKRTLTPKTVTPGNNHVMRNTVCMIVILCSLFFIIYFSGIYIKFFDFLYGA